MAHSASRHSQISRQELERENAELRRRLEQSSSASDQELWFLRRIIDISPFLIYVQDYGGRIVFCSRSLCEAWRRDTSEVIGLTPDELVADGVNPASARALFAGFDDNPNVAQMPGADGNTRWLRTRRIPLDLGHEGNILGVAVDVTEQKLAQEALTESEAFMRKVIDLVPGSLFVKDCEGKHLLANQELANVFSVEAQDIIGKDDHELLAMSGFPMANLDLFDEQDRQVRRTGRPLNVAQEKVLMRDGSVRWYDSRKVPLVWRGQDRLILGIVTDVTERVQANLANEQNERVLRQVLDTNSSMIFCKDPEGRYVLVNRTYAEAYGLPANELLGKTDLDFCAEYGIPLEQAVSYRAQDDQVRQTGQRVSIAAERHMSPDGSGHWLATIKSPLTLDGEPGYVLGVSHDITDTRIAMQSLSESEALLRAVIDADPNHVYLQDPEGRYVLANRARAASYGLQPEALVGRTDRELCESLGIQSPRMADEAAADAQAWASDGLVEVTEQRSLAPDGQEVWLHGIKRALTWRGDRGYLLGVMQDVTERRQLEEQLRQAAKMEAIGRLAGGVAHDFNNLLTVINGYAEMLLAGLPEHDPGREDIRQIAEAGHRAADLTKRLLAFARQQSLDVRPCDVREIIVAMARMLQRMIGEDVVLDLDLAQDTGLVQADPAQIEQIVVNLAVNARDAMPHGGMLELVTGNVELGEESLSHLDAPPGSYVAISVRDTGMGMTQEILDHLFEPFFTTKDVGKGTGLGLAMVYGYVLQGQGGIDIKSQAGEGTTVSVLLPLVGGAPSSLEAKPAITTTPRGSETILVVEDQPEVAGLVRRFLDRLGYQVIVSGAQAATSLPWPEVPVDLILTDVVMPGLGGPEMIQGLRARGVELPVVYMSGQTRQGVQARGGDDEYFLRKPFNADELSGVIRRALAQTRG